MVARRRAKVKGGLVILFSRYRIFKHVSQFVYSLTCEGIPGLFPVPAY